MKILIAVDGSSFSDLAVEEVASRPWPAGSEARVVSVVEPPLIPAVDSLTLPEAYYDELEKAGEEQAQAALDRAIGCLQSDQKDRLILTSEIVKGYPKHAILDEAERWGSDLIVVGSHGYSGLTRLLLGSVSQAVATHAKCSVEIVRARH
jgi:nucleotide-binding universal stress UspA family protein